jgi:putative DNA primase/helicase
MDGKTPSTWQESAVYSPLYGYTLFDYGIEVPPGASGEIKTTCPQCSHTRRKKRDRCLSVNVDSGVWFCWHCGWRGGLKEGARRLLPPKKFTPPQSDAAAQFPLIRLWKKSRLISPGDPVDRYLRHRGIALEEYPPVLRYHPDLCYFHEETATFTRHPAMLARIDGADGQAVSLHRTYLTFEGHKAAVPKPKKCMPPSMPGAIRGGAIRLFPPGKRLGVSEGIENALSAHRLTGLPVWSALCAHGLAGLVIPDEVSEAILFADFDAAGVNAAEVLTKRLVRQTLKVRVAFPAATGTDWNDFLRNHP